MQELNVYNQSIPNGRVGNMKNCDIKFTIVDE